MPVYRAREDALLFVTMLNIVDTVFTIRLAFQLSCSKPSSFRFVV